MTRTKFNLDDAEKRALRTRGGADAEAYVAVLSFRGPRGARYRPVRTKAALSEAAVRAEAKDIRHRPYARGAYCTGVTLYLIDWRGNVLADESLKETA